MRGVACGRGLLGRAVTGEGSDGFVECVLRVEGWVECKIGSWVGGTVVER